MEISGAGNSLGQSIKEQSLKNQLKVQRIHKSLTRGLAGANPYEQSIAMSIVTEIIGESKINSGRGSQSSRGDGSARHLEADESIPMDSMIQSSAPKTKFITQGEIRERRRGPQRSQAGAQDRPSDAGAQDDPSKKQNLRVERSQFIDKKFRQLNNNKKYGFTTPSEYIEKHMKRKCLGDKVKKLESQLREQYQKDGSEDASGTVVPVQAEDVAQQLLRKLRQKHDQTLLDDLVPGAYAQFPVEKMTKLIQKDYDKSKYAHNLAEKMDELKTYEGEENKRLEELRKVGIELERHDLINKKFQQLKMKLIFDS